MKILRILLFILIGLCLLDPANALASAEVYQDSGRIPVDEVLWNECTGENVHLSGIMLWTNHGVVTPSGILQWSFKTRYQGVIGVGETSGIKYQGISGEQGFGTAAADPELPYHYAAGRMFTIRLVAQGKAPDLVMKVKGRLTVTPDFKWLAYIDSYQLICK